VPYLDAGDVASASDALGYIRLRQGMAQRPCHPEDNCEGRSRGQGLFLAQGGELKPLFPYGEHKKQGRHVTSPAHWTLPSA